jgi:hypothetical protein
MGLSKQQYRQFNLKNQHKRQLRFSLKAKAKFGSWTLCCIFTIEGWLGLQKNLMEFPRKPITII